ncbi:hypothetical protein CERSUDRAFT_45511, partial [Gelatoporia subvermispora B]
LILKAHIEGHGPSCRTVYLFNFAQGVGGSHSKTTEQEWTESGQTATSTCEMGPAAPHLALDDHWGWWNWCKLTRLGVYLASCIVDLFGSHFL